MEEQGDLYRRLGEWTNHNKMKTDHREKSKESITMETQDISPEVHVLAGTLRPCCVDHYLVVRRLRGVAQTLSNTWTPQQPTHKCGSSMTHAIH
jgi:hypothetical protein